MKKRDVLILFLIALGFLFIICPVSAGIKDVPAGGTVFIGEQDLDISGITGVAAVDLGWWAPGAAIDTTSPYMVSVPDPTNFDVTSTEFGSHTGIWYQLPAKTAVFNVAVPQLDIKVEDSTVNIDVTDKWVPTDDELKFRIETNMVPISQRGGGNPITIRVQSPVGGILTSLIDNTGNPTSLVDYQITTTPQYTGSIWGTKNRATYPPGTYTIWAESYTNSQSPGVPLITSRKVSLLNQDQNPLIVNSAYVTNPTTQMTLVPTKVSTTIVTTAPTTMKTSPPTTLVTTVIPPPTAEVVMSKTTTVTDVPITSPPIPTTKKSSGFEGVLAGLALIAALAFCIKK